MIRASFRQRRAAAAMLSLALAACSADGSFTGPEPVLQSSVATSQASAPTLLYCPTEVTTSASRRIGPEGGMLNLAGTRLRVPAGAVPEETEFVITLPASPYLELDIRAVGYEHYRFQRPVEVTVSYARCRSREAEVQPLSAWHIDLDTRDLLEDMGGEVSRAGKKITFETGHLSGYAIAW